MILTNLYRKLFICVFLLVTTLSASADVLVEAESFANTGGWVIDQQSMDIMGSPYLMAHGLGRPVQDATTKIMFERSAEYKIWVRTRDWVAPWKIAGIAPAMKAVGEPGKFQLLINGHIVGKDFGVKGVNWQWHEGGKMNIPKGIVTLTLRDLTGFNGRCDAILFSTDYQFTPPNKDPEMTHFRRKLLGYSETPPIAGNYDLAVVGGGMAGICTAISAARHGCEVVLIQNRPVLGGNNSSEVRVGLSGLIHQDPYPKLGNLVDEIGPVGHWNLWEANQNPDTPRSKRIFDIIEKYPEKKQHNAGPESNYEDQIKIDAVHAEKNITLFLNTHVNGVEMDGNRITALIGQNIRTGERLKFKSKLFADCTGDGSLGFLAKADFHMGREAKKQTDESLAPKEADKLVMGTSVQWYSVEDQMSSSFPNCPWAVQFDETNCIPSTRGDWNWETGADRDQVTEIERIRDYALRVVYGNWSVLKNHEQFKDKFAKRLLKWVAYIGGKRESRRLLGHVILKQQDIVNQKEYADECVTTTWTIDLHYPRKPVCACDAFQSIAKHLKISPYPIPYRCLYSRNIDNLMMAGRNISVTHVALGTTRVMRTTGMMGEVLGMASGLCKKYSCEPNEIYEKHLPEFKGLLKQGVPSR